MLTVRRTVSLLPILSLVFLSGCYPGGLQSDWNGFSPKSAWAWNNAGYGPGAAKAWINAGVVDPNSAHQWQLLLTESHIPPTTQAQVASAATTKSAGDDWRYGTGQLRETVGKLTSQGLTPQDVSPYVTAGLRMAHPGEILLAMRLREHGLTYRRAAYYAEHHVSFSKIGAYDRSVERIAHAKAVYKAKFRKIKRQVCHGVVGNAYAFFTTTPYAIAGKCYKVPLGHCQSNSA